MTPDSWERRNVPYSPGYNNPATGVQFTVSYDQGLDRLIVQSNFPVLGSLDSAQGEGENPDGSPGWTFSIGSGNWIIDSPTEAHLPGAWGFLVGNPGVTGDIQQLDFYTAALALIGTWTGTVLITEPVPADPLIESYSYSDFYDLATSPPSFLSQECSNIATRTSTPSIFFYTQNMLTGGADGVRLVVDGNPVDYTVTADPQFFGDGAIAADGYFLFADPALLGSQITSAQPIDSGGNPVGVVTPLVINYNIASAAGIQSGDSDVLEIQWSFCPEQPTRISVGRCPSGGQNYYDPLGPNAGLNPVGATIVQWDTSAIIIDHAAFIGLGPIDRIETEDQYGRTMLAVGNPLATV